MRIVNLMLGFVFCLIGAVGNSATSNCEQEQCIAVVDVGSTGSRLHIYSYDLDTYSSPIKITERWSKKIKPGFATLEANEKAVNAYLTTLFADSPANHLPVYFFATAGMRTLPEAKQQEFYSLVKKWFWNQSNWYLYSARTITGSEEGLLGWLAVNYQLGTLTQENKAVGVLDMGGASVQVTFPTKNSDGINPEDLQEVNIYGKHFKLFVHSFLGLGKNAVESKFLESSPCFTTNYALPTGEFAQGDAYACENKVGSLVNNSFRVNQIVMPAVASNPVDNWYVLGGLMYLVKSPVFDFTHPDFTSQDLLERGNSQICQPQWSVLSSQYPKDEFLYSYCLSSAYYYALMVEGYGIEPQQSIKLLDDERQNSSDWTIGAVLHQLPENS